MMSVGFDLGNLMSKVCQLNPKEQMPTIVRNTASNEQTPSVISFRQRQERYFGDDAVSHLTSQPASTVCDLKKIIGVDLTEEFVKANGLNFPVKCAQNTIELSLEDGDRSVAVPHVVGMLLKRLLEFARQQKSGSPGVMPASAVVAVPTHFSDKQCGAIRDALLIAGVPADRAHIIPESVAELLCYHHSHYAELNVSEPTTIVMVDVGHFQSFVTLARMTKTKIEVIATRSSPTGSGMVDMGLLRDAVKHIQDTKKTDISSLPKALARISKEARKCKEMLSMLETSNVTVETLTDEIDLQMKVSRETLNQHAQPLADGLVGLCEQVMEAAGPDFSKDAVNRVEILGGGIRMPCLQERLKEYWGKPLATTMDGTLSLTQGCAIYGVVQQPTSETTRILQSLVSKADESRRIMDTLHHVEIVPAPEVPGVSMSDEEMAKCMEVEADLQARDDKHIATATAKNSIEEYVYATRSNLDSPDMQKALGDDCTKVRDMLTKVEEWLWDMDEDTAADVYTAKLESTKKEILDGFPAISKELERQAAEQAKRDAAMAEEARKAAAEQKKEPRTDGERIKFAEERKDQGNGLLKQEHYSESITRYVQALAYLGEVYASEDADIKAKKEAISLSCHLNIANAAIKVQMYQKAIDNCNKALELQPGSAKAYFRKGQALSLKSEFTQAKEALDKALELAPGDKLIEKELKQNAKKMEQHKAKEKKMYANMFGS
jgi:molecular chaperone DnaK (HSP70)